jgi:hypothetical protein
MHTIGGSPAEEEEELYEYFPLSVDDWLVWNDQERKTPEKTLTCNRTPLVDTVYRPHLVHHIALPQEIKAQQIRSRSKRYFSAE